MDIALRYLDRECDPLLLCLDADSPVAPGYLAAVTNFFARNPDAVAGVTEYRHRTGLNPAWDAAIVQYELYLRHYVCGLEYAGSPYAYPSIGSTIVCRADAYVRAGGMRIRSAGEDFYFLQSLRKIGSVGRITAACVHPSSRPSDRVPFGTGPAVRRLCAGDAQHFHHPAIFETLRGLLSAVETAMDSELADADAMTARQYGIAANFLGATGFADAWRKIVRNVPAGRPARLQAFHTWFDAFRTLKFVHFCEAHEPARFCSLPWNEAFRLPAPGSVTIPSDADFLEEIRTFPLRGVRCFSQYPNP
jgi:hypothetical protein